MKRVILQENLYSQYLNGASYFSFCFIHILISTDQKHAIFLILTEVILSGTEKMLNFW